MAFEGYGKFFYTRTLNFKFDLKVGYLITTLLLIMWIELLVWPLMFVFLFIWIIVL